MYWISHALYYNQNKQNISNNLYIDYLEFLFVFYLAIFLANLDLSKSSSSKLQSL